MNNFPWEEQAQQQFDAILAKVPVFMRAVAQDKVGKKAVQLAQARAHVAVKEQDLVEAFFDQTPFGFHGPMKMDMESLGIDYKKYGF